MSKIIIPLLITFLMCSVSISHVSAAPRFHDDVNVNIDITKSIKRSEPFNQLTLSVPDEDDSWDLDITEDLGLDCVKSCDDFEEVCSGGDECELLDNCTIVCHRADGSQSVLSSEDLQSEKKKERGKQCVHGKLFEEETCKCDVGYEGDFCDVKQCSLPCLHGGTCIKLENQLLGCACTPDWQGSLCQDKKCTLPCVRGSCLYSPRDGSPFCNCPYGWTGEFCENKSSLPAFFFDES